MGIDTGSKKEAFTVKSHACTYLNMQVDAITDVKNKLETRRNARRARRHRNTPYRQMRKNRKGLSKKGRIPPSTKARWQWKLNILDWLKKMFPISNTIVEDIKASTKGKRGLDRSFSSLEVGKKWFYNQIENLTTKRGYETKILRDQLGLNKSRDKMSEKFDAHCVDSWVLSNSIVGGHTKPDNTNILFLKPLRFHRRQLHMFRFAKLAKRKHYGGTISMGIKRGSLAKHKKYGLVHIGGSSNGLISLHSVGNNKRLCMNAKVGDCDLLAYSSWTFRS